MKLKLVNLMEENFKKGFLGALKQPPLCHAFLAAMIPEGLGIDVEIVDEQLGPIDFDMDCDVVAFSVTTHSAKKCYSYAKEFKKRKKKVILGGYHVTLCPDEAQKHADSIVVGEAENAWPQLLKDLVKNKLKKKYVSKVPVDLSKTPTPRRDLFNLKKYFFPNVVIATRGCPYMCSYCASSKIFGRHRRRDVNQVIREIKSLKFKKMRELLIFADDELFFPKKEALDFFRKLKKLNIIWTGQATTTALFDKQLMKAAAESGCVALIVGVESINKRTQKYLKKYQNLRDGLDKAIDYANDLGILVGALIMTGLDADTPRSIRDTVKFLKKSRFGLIQAGVLRAYPTTSIYKELLDEKRIRKDWWLNPSNYEDAFNEVVPDYLKVYYTPRHFSPGELQIKTIEAIIKTNTFLSYSRLKNLFRLFRKGHKMFFLNVMPPVFFNNLKLRLLLRKLKKLRKKKV